MRTQWASKIKDILHGQPDRGNWKGERKTGEPEGEREEMEVVERTRRQRKLLRGYATWLLKNKIDDQRKYWKYRKNV